MKKKISLIVFLTVLATGIIHLYNRFIYYLATIDNLLNSSKGNYYEWRFGRIYYKKQGSGKPILLIHDLNAHSSGYEWKKTASVLAEHNTVYTIDLLGCGRSEKPNIIYTNFLYVQMLNDFIKYIIGEKTDIIATGESASFVVMACNMDHDLIGRIAMINPLSLNELAKIPTKRTKTLKLLIQTPIIGTFLYNILESRKNIEDIFHTQYFYDNSRIDDSITNAYYESSHIEKMHSKYLFSSIKGLYTKANIAACIKNTTNSIFIITGGEVLEYQDIASQYQKFAPAVETISIQNTKYLPQLESPLDFVEQIHIFFELDN